MRRGEGPLKDARWKQADLASQPIGEEADVVVASYMLNELEQSAGLRAAEKAWQAAGKPPMRTKNSPSWLFPESRFPSGRAAGCCAIPIRGRAM